MTETVEQVVERLHKKHGWMCFGRLAHEELHQCIKDAFLAGQQQEREACAKVAESFLGSATNGFDGQRYWTVMERIVAAIRRRGEERSKPNGL